MLSYLTLAVRGADTLLNQSQQQAETIATEWNNRWQDVITPDSSLYAALTHVGVIFAVGSLILWGLKILQDYVEKGSTEFLHELIWPVIVIAFLGGNGNLLSQATLAIRDIINTTNQQVLATTSASYSLDAAYQKAKNNDLVKVQIGTLLKQCQSFTGTQQIECLRDANEQAQSLIDQYHLNGSWWDSLKGRIQSAIDQAQGAAVVFAPFNALIGASNQDMIRGFLVSLQVAFQQTLEVSLLLTALLGPMALGLSLLPVGAKPVFAWVTAMGSVAIAKLCFNIVVGLVASVIAQADAGDHLWFAMFVAFLAPVLSTALAAGGGMAIWSALTDATSRAIATVSEVIPG